MRDNQDLRIVLDLKQAVRTKSFHLPPNGKYRHRLVIELAANTGEAAMELADNQCAVPLQSVVVPPPLQSHQSVTPIQASIHTSAPPRVATTAAEDNSFIQTLFNRSFTPWRQENAAPPAPRAINPLRPVIIAIDAGHGGKDPGAIGAQGTQEKEITLAVARKLKQLINQETGMRAVMIRDGDYFVALRKRIQIARQHRADLFISIHADAYANRDVRGSSVFTLSERGATSEAAKWLATRENQADLIGGIDLGKSNEEVAGVLMEMTQNLTLEHSNIAAKRILDQLSGLGDLHQQRVQSAGFAVLKAPDIPSLLVETAFISNPNEENRLRDAAFQKQIAQAVFTGIRGYFHRYPPPETLLTQRR
ncbi:N-acetylmuramoyl-L-alanine amidase [Thiospirillum jenense]|uniref:N-acetylmuramoyl-L-alanine amidase AmiC n=2 Tax=Thiospirillum jenense TaxID=1653858 RepID=A0A839H6K8_9GAMM|nr:N-acetylmuramoyl-L-alanine amidase [Thiospirillum jenense]